MYLLDTNTCIYFLNGLSESIRQQIMATSPKEILIPTVVKAELLLGAYKSKTPEKTLGRLEQFLAPFASLPFDDKAAYVYATIRKQTEERGTCVGPNDLMIAAIAMANLGTLVTRNVREFSRIPGLVLENWWKD